MASAANHRFLRPAVLAVAAIALAFGAIRASRPRQPDLPPDGGTPGNPSSHPSPVAAGRRVGDLAKRTDLTLPQKIEALLATLPGLPSDDRLPALQAATELIPDEDHPRYRRRLINLADTPDLRDLIAQDALSRGEEIGLPVLLDILRLAPGDDERRDIRDLLEAYLDHDYGPSADEWELPVKTWLAEHVGHP